MTPPHDADSLIRSTQLTEILQAYIAAPAA